LSGISHGNGKFVVISNQGKILESVDDVDWLDRNLEWTYSCQAIAHAHNIFVVLCSENNFLVGYV
jgi:hypothetical protein